MYLIDKETGKTGSEQNCFPGGILQMNYKRIASHIAKYAILIISSICFVLPLYIMFCIASGGNTDINAGPILPGGDLWRNIRHILFETGFMQSFLFTLKYTVVQTILTVLICGLAGFGFEVYHDKHKDKLFKVVLFAMMISITPLMVPLFKMYTAMHLIDTMWGIMAPFLASPLIIMIFRQNARNFPYDLVEAARLDGLKEPGIFFRIFLPCMRSTVSCGIIIAFLNAWNSYQWPRVIMYDESKIPMTVYLTLGMKGDNMTLVMLSMIPSMAVFFIFQKFFVEGMNGAVK